MEKIYRYLKVRLIELLPKKIIIVIKRVHYGRLLNSFKIDKEPDLKIIKHLVDPGDFVIDIGANFGLYTKFLSEMVGRGGMVYSVEPIPITFDMLNYIIRKFKLSNVKSTNCAVSNKNNCVTMQIPSYPWGGKDFYRARIVDNSKLSKSLEIVEVKTVTLDSKFKEVFDKVTFVKCDVEGHELQCIEGAESFLANSQSAWMVEINGDPDVQNTSACLVFEKFLSKGYSPWWFDGIKLRRREAKEKSTNYFFLRDTHLNKLRLKIPDFFVQ